MSIWDIMNPPPKGEAMSSRMPQNAFITPGADPLVENHDGTVGAHLAGDGTYWTARVSLFGRTGTGVSRSKDRAKAYALEDIAKQLSQPETESRDGRGDIVASGHEETKTA